MVEAKRRDSEEERNPGSGEDPDGSNPEEDGTKT